MIWTICQSPPKSSPSIFFEFLHIGGSKFYGEEEKKPIIPSIFLPSFRPNKT